MDDKKFCFVICANDEMFLEECLLYINNLVVPEGFTTQILVMRGAESIVSAYNQAMLGSDAKYKIYLHQDVFILNKTIMQDVLDLFKSDQMIGMIGVIGCYQMPESGIWWEGKIGFGDAYQDSIINTRRTTGNTIQGKNYQEVQALDGILMITQFDIKWREDILKGWHYYDASQCMEFYRAGYKVVVPKQSEPWCLHDGNIGVKLAEDVDYMDSKSVFLEEYGNEIGIS